MGTLRHPLVDDRMIQGEGTQKSQWLQAFEKQPLPPLDLEQFRSKRVVIVSPHPDDEILGCAGLMQQLMQLDCNIIVLAVTNGTQSHPQSKKYTPEQLNQLRPLESLAALECLAIAKHIQRIGLNLTDGQVHLQINQLWSGLDQTIQPEDFLICTYKYDGHPDHEAVGKTVQAFAKVHQLPCLQVLIWAWHWANPLDPRIQWQQAYAYCLTDEQILQKRQAILQFNSQTQADESTGQNAVLSPAIIERLLMPYEVYLCE